MHTDKIEIECIDPQGNTKEIVSIHKKYVEVYDNRILQTALNYLLKGSGYSFKVARQVKKTNEN